MQAKLISFVISETLRVKKAKEAVETPALKSAPHYFETTVPQQFIVAQEKVKIGDREGTMFLKTYPADVLIAEARFEVADIFLEEIIPFKEEVITQCRETLKKRGGRDVEKFSEEYSVFVVSGYQGEPEQFFKYRERIASLLKSEKLPLDPLEIDYTLSSNIKYAKNDLVIVDWDGAIIFDPEEDFESTLELLELANLQLLRYRLLDKELDERLEYVAKIFQVIPEKRKLFFFRTILGGREVRSALRSVIKIRSTSLFDFQSLEREIKLIGDWYSARLYELTAKKFKLDEWRSQIKDKLDALEDIYSIASERFSWSPERIELVGWFVLLLGWAVILAFDLWVAFFRN